MVTAVVAACAVLVACGLILLWLQRARRESERHLDTILRQLDGHLEAMSQNVARAVDAVLESSSQRPLPAADARLRPARGDARRGDRCPNGRRRGRPTGREARRTTAGGFLRERCGDASSSTGRSARRTDRRFDTAAIDWTYSPSGDPGGRALPIGARHSARRRQPEHRGVVATYALAADAFRPEHAAAVRETLPRRRRRVVQRAALRGGRSPSQRRPGDRHPNRRGYELELGREVARAERSGRPLSVVSSRWTGARPRPARERRRAGRAGAAPDAGDETRRHLVSPRRERARDPAPRHGGVRCNRPDDGASGTRPGRRSRADVSTVAVGLVERLPAETQRSSTRASTDVRHPHRHRVHARGRPERIHGGPVHHPQHVSNGSDLARPLAIGRPPPRHARDARARTGGHARLRPLARGRRARGGRPRRGSEDTAEKRQTPS